MVTLNFASLSHLARHVAHIQSLSNIAASAGLRLSADEILKETKLTFGDYQPKSGPFEAWKPLTQHTMDDRVRAGFPADEPLLRTGKLRDSYHVDSGHMWAGVGSDLDYALEQEVGHPGKNLPARSTLGIGFVRAEKKSFGALNTLISALFMYDAGKARSIVMRSAMKNIP